MVKNKGIVMMLICTVFTAFGQFFLKKGTAIMSFNIISLITNYNLIIGLCFYGVGAFIMIYALKFGELNVLYPIISFTFIWITILSVMFLNEEASTNKIMGIGSILIGVYFIGKGGKK